MLGLLDLFHGTVVFHRFRNRCRSRGTDVVLLETARNAMKRTKEGSRDSVRTNERMCAHQREGKGRKRMAAMEGKGER